MSQSAGHSEVSSQNQTPDRSGVQKQVPDSSGASQTDGNQAPQKKPLHLSDLFKRKNPEDPSDTSFSVEDDEIDDPSKPVDSLDRLMKRHGLTEKQVYDIKVPIKNGEPMTLGALKDRVGDLVDFEVRELEFDQRRQESEGELLRAQQEMREIMAHLPKDALKPELVDRVRKQHEATQSRERQLTLQHIPSWRSEEARTADLEGMVEMLGDYGFPPQFIGTVVDHRAMKFIRDAFLTRKKIKAALAEVKVPPPKGNKRPSPKTAQPAARPSEDSKRETAHMSSRERFANLFSKNRSE